MPDPAQSAVTALTGSTTETVGRFSYHVPTDTWWWSSSLYTIHGFDPGEIVPTTALMTAHQHPEDRAGTAELITAAIKAGNRSVPGTASSTPIGGCIPWSPSAKASATPPGASYR